MGKSEEGFHRADGAGGRRALGGGSTRGKAALEEGERGALTDGARGGGFAAGGGGERGEAVARPTELGLPEEGGGGAGCGARRSWVLHQGWSSIREVGKSEEHGGYSGGDDTEEAGPRQRGGWVAHTGAIARLLAGGHVVGGRRGGEIQICADTTETCPSSTVGNPAVDADHGVEAWRLATGEGICVGDDRRLRWRSARHGRDEWALPRRMGGDVGTETSIGTFFSLICWWLTFDDGDQSAGFFQWWYCRDMMGGGRRGDGDGDPVRLV
ncbi:putative basic proline-rich protein-like [Iris pallida]|uniref:Basic proline-rich protein-like n=1 Tax=Iris pallida TaxID=29817 RepID=A0AAX6DH99_IRIPA|nr:putative basic proline-rich protein-like [Iris pallida]